MRYLERHWPHLLLLGVVGVVVVAVLFVDDGAGGTKSRSATPPPTAGAVAPSPRAPRCSSARRGLEFYRARARYWNVRMGRLARAERRERPRTCERIREVAELARANAHRARARHDRLYAELDRKWGCIRRHEGAWTTATGNGYYGALQMDTDFQYAYGREYVRRWGLAHRWPPVVQLLVAERAYDSGRGFGPWPNTRRMCGV